ncbi:MAG: class I SAM-dependent methyltransferase [Candidatus Heimdallarchaeaceae archaeon]
MNYINFDRVAAVYDRTRAVPVEIIGILIRKINKELRTTFGSPPYQILSLGIGSGRVEKDLSSTNNHLIGIDVSELMLKELKRKTNVESISVLQADACNLPFRGRFHLTIAIHLIHLIQNLEKFLNEIARTSQIAVMGDVYTDAYQSKVYYYFLNILLTLGWEKQESMSLTSYLLTEMSKRGFVVEDFSETILTTQTHASILESIKKRYFSWLWDVPEKIYQNAIKLLETKLKDEEINLNESYRTISSVNLQIFKKMMD